MNYGFSPFGGIETDGDRIRFSDYRPEPPYCPPRPRSDVLTEKNAAIWLHGEESRIETKLNSTWKYWFDYVLSQAKQAPKPLQKIRECRCIVCKESLDAPAGFVIDPAAKWVKRMKCEYCKGGKES